MVKRKSAPVQPQHESYRAYQKQHVPEPRQRGLGRHALDLGNIVIDAAHDLTQPCARVEAR